jgi:hypothetical protein
MLICILVVLLAMSVGTGTTPRRSAELPPLEAYSFDINNPPKEIHLPLSGITLYRVDLDEKNVIDFKDLIEDPAKSAEEYDAVFDGAVKDIMNMCPEGVSSPCFFPYYIIAAGRVNFAKAGYNDLDFITGVFIGRRWDSEATKPYMFVYNIPTKQTAFIIEMDNPEAWAVFGEGLRYFMLRYYRNWPTRFTDPATVTVMQYFDKSERENEKLAGIKRHYMAATTPDTIKLFTDKYDWIIMLWMPHYTATGQINSKSEDELRSKVGELVRKFVEESGYPPDSVEVLGVGYLTPDITNWYLPVGVVKGESENLVPVYVFIGGKGTPPDIFRDRGFRLDLDSLIGNELGTRNVGTLRSGGLPAFFGMALLSPNYTKATGGKAGMIVFAD